MSSTNGSTPAAGFDLDALLAEANLEPFTFTAYGRTWALPHMSDLDAWPLIAAAESGSDAGAMLAVLSLAFGDDWDEFHGHVLPQRHMAELFEAYQAHAGIKPGESAASTSSSVSMVRR